MSKISYSLRDWNRTLTNVMYYKTSPFCSVTHDTLLAWLAGIFDGLENNHGCSVFNPEVSFYIYFSFCLVIIYKQLFYFHYYKREINRPQTPIK